MMEVVEDVFADHSPLDATIEAIRQRAAPQLRVCLTQWFSKLKSRQLPAVSIVYAGSFAAGSLARALPHLPLGGAALDQGCA